MEGAREEQRAQPGAAGPPGDGSDLRYGGESGDRSGGNQQGSGTKCMREKGEGGVWAWFPGGGAHWGGGRFQLEENQLL